MSRETNGKTKGRSFSDGIFDGLFFNLKYQKGTTKQRQETAERDATACHDARFTLIRGIGWSLSCASRDGRPTDGQWPGFEAHLPPRPPTLLSPSIHITTALPAGTNHIYIPATIG